jgi:hypothetical protein
MRPDRASGMQWRQRRPAPTHLLHYGGSGSLVFKQPKQ